MRVFISYRREDSEDITGRIYDRLAGRYGEEQVFLDIDNIPPGKDFREVITQALNGSAAVLAVIGPNWCGPDHTPPRIQEDNDFVRVEVAMALTKGFPILPLLVRGAAMPKPADLPKDLQPLCFLNGLHVRTTDFGHDIGILYDWIGLLDSPPKTKTSVDGLDSLTGLLNRPGLAKGLEVKKLRGNAGICALADIDFFKSINDMFGYEVGDEVIKAVAEELSSAVGDLGVVARTAGQEFLVRLFPEYTRQGTAALREFFLAIPKRLTKKGLPEATCTVGLSLERFDKHENKVQEAYLAMHRGKNEGGNRFSQISIEEADQAKNPLRVR